MRYADNINHIINLHLLIPVKCEQIMYHVVKCASRLRSWVAGGYGKKTWI